MIPLCQNILNEHCNVLGVFDLNQYQRRPGNLYAKLKEIKKSKYDNNDRIIFTLFDHDFYLDNRGPGWALYNLQLILQELDISNFFCLLLTNQPDYNDYTSYVQKHLTTDDFFIRSITTMINKGCVGEDAVIRAPLIEHINKAYCVLSRQSRPHRTFFMSKLMNADLADYGLIGYNNISQTGLEHLKIKSTESPIDNIFLKIPYDTQRLLLKKDLNKIILNNFSKSCLYYKNFSENINLSNKFESCSFTNNTPIAQSLLYVGLETQVHLEKPFTSRISFRGIVEHRPFVIFGCVRTLKFLKSKGFKTFGDFWDESYDEIEDLETRIDKIIDIIKYVSSLSITDLKNLYSKMKPIIEFNHDFYYNDFIHKEEQYLKEELLKNLKGL